MVTKFRAFLTETKTIHRVLQIDLSRSMVSLKIENASEWYWFKEVVLMQSTGLKDKNGVEIFEGDVLLHTSSSVNYSDTYWHSYVQVYRIDSGAYRIKGKHIYHTELMSARNRLEVVGNIYQNQNLLDKEYFSTSDGIVVQANES
ncbi:YopX family protein [Enterococcus sp.]|uniref:YopX family protein n=1 Tax=Enterococcus sp. TaxID=35783 RepID=UPI003995872F